jgi:glycine/D-amino acid oxidase-like deaminating enzyme
MDLRSNYPFWLLQKGIITSYPSLKENTEADVAVIGGGISGALTAWRLQQEGFSVLLADRRHIGMGSTAASTALLQYEIDIPLWKLAGIRGEKDAVKSYLLCLEAISTIGKVCRQVKANEVFSRRPSFQFASYKKHTADLHTELVWRKKAGIDVDWLDEKEVVKKFGFSKPAGLLSADGACLDAYTLTHALLKSGALHGMKIYDHTTIVSINHHKKGVTLLTGENKKIKARKLVIACGYESQRYIPFKVQELHSTFAIASEPMKDTPLWYKDSLIWETANPYLYIRTTNDKRIIIGGKDIASSSPQKRDMLLPQKAKELERAFSKLFPGILFKTDFKWAGSFGSTKDGLPFIGSIRQMPHTCFALGLGGNGITFSMIAADMIADIFRKRPNPSLPVFSFDRIKQISLSS